MGDQQTATIVNGRRAGTVFPCRSGNASYAQEGPRRFWNNAV